MDLPLSFCTIIGRFVPVFVQISRERSTFQKAPCAEFETRAQLTFRIWCPPPPFILAASSVIRTRANSSVHVRYTFMKTTSTFKGLMMTKAL